MRETHTKHAKRACTVRIVHTRARAHIHAQYRTYTYTYPHTHTHKVTYTHSHTHTYTHTHAHTHTHALTHIHTLTHTHNLTYTLTHILTTVPTRIRVPDKRCSGKMTCEIRIPDAELETSKHGYLKELITYLKITYTCLHGMSAPSYIIP